MGKEGEVSAGLLDAVDPGVGGQRLVGLRGKGDAGAAGHIVQDHGQLGALRDVLIVLDEAGLAGLVVIGADQQGGISAGVLGVLGQIDGGGGVVAAGAGNDLDPAVYPLDAVFHSGDVLPDGHSSGFAGGAADTDRVHTGGDLGIDEAPEGFVVDIAVLVKGSDQSGTGAGKYRSSHRTTPFLNWGRN